MVTQVSVKLYLPLGKRCLGCSNLEMVDSRKGACIRELMVPCPRNPPCFSYVAENRSYQESMNAVPITDCKTCELLEFCLEAYDERVYYGWGDFDDSLDPDKEYDPMFEDLFEDDEE